MFYDGVDLDDTTEIQVYDLSGNLLRSRKSYIKSDLSNWDSTFHSIFKWGPYQHPTKAGSIVYGVDRECRIVEVDKQTLEVLYTMPREPIDLYHSSPDFYGYTLYDDKIACGGMCGYVRNILLGNYRFQSYYQTRAWNGDTLEKKVFGNFNVEEKSYAYHYNPENGTNFLGAAAPFNNARLNAQEYRQMIIHRFNQFGKDSIVLYGNKNHVSIGMKQNSLGDLFVLSTYTDAWTTDSSYLQITKIPGFAISLVEQKEISSDIQLYPNPTHDFIRIDELMHRPEHVAVYDQQGKLHFETNTFEDQIDVRNLPAGIYVVVLTVDNGQKHSAIFKKE